MTTPSLPSYVTILRDGYQHERESGLLRSEMESGPQKQVRIKSKVMVVRTCKFFFETLANFEAFELWYSTVLKEGSLWFTFQDPVSKTTKTARFVGGGFTASPMGDDISAWQATVKIETWG